MAAAGGVVYSFTLGAVDYHELSGGRGLFMSITFLAIIILGGLGTIYGSILGAFLVIYGQRFIADNGADAPILGIPVEKGWLSTGELNGVLFGLLVIGFLLLEPRGLAACGCGFDGGSRSGRSPTDPARRTTRHDKPLREEPSMKSQRATRRLAAIGALTALILVAACGGRSDSDDAGVPPASTGRSSRSGRSLPRVVESR